MGLRSGLARRACIRRRAGHVIHRDRQQNAGRTRRNQSPLWAANDGRIAVSGSGRRPPPDHHPGTSLRSGQLIRHTGTGDAQGRSRPADFTGVRPAHHAPLVSHRRQPKILRAIFPQRAVYHTGISLFDGIGWTLTGAGRFCRWHADFRNRVSLSGGRRHQTIP